MRKGIVLLLVLASVGCARLQQVLEPEPEPKKTAVAETNSPVTPEAPPALVVARPRFRCSDGTTASSFEECEVNMARSRLPPPAGPDPTKP
jgi:hypothetical protein